MIELGEEQALAIAMAIKDDIAAYIASHRAKYEAYLRTEKEDPYRRRKNQEDPGHLGDNQ